jgi:hypothetical protein
MAQGIERVAEHSSAAHFSGVGSTAQSHDFGEVSALFPAFQRTPHPKPVPAADEIFRTESKPSAGKALAIWIY